MGERSKGGNTETCTRKRRSVGVKNVNIIVIPTFPVCHLVHFSGWGTKHRQMSG